MEINTRTKVIEKAVILEEVVSKILSNILDIDETNSLSFSNKNLALSFNSKINLLVDLKFVPSKISSDFQLFAEIRNKFAHVRYVDDFTKCFEVLKERKNKFKSYGKKNDEQSLTEEEYLNTCFDAFCFNLEIWLKAVIKTLQKSKHDEMAKTTVVNIMKIYFEPQASDSAEINSYIFSSIKPLIQEIDTEFDLAKEVEIEQKKQLKI